MLVKTKNAPKALKRKINLKFFFRDMGVPILGEGVLPTWEFFPRNTVFISEDVPKQCLQCLLNKPFYRLKNSRLCGIDPYQDVTQVGIVKQIRLKVCSDVRPPGKAIFSKQGFLVNR